MPVIYKVKIDHLPNDNSYRITWTNVAKQTQDHFDQSVVEITPEEVDWLWLNNRNQKQIGTKLFRFLDGDTRHLQGALDDASQHGEPLVLQLRACKSVSDWPFELLAKNATFLVPGHIHLLRRVSDWGEKKQAFPQDRPLKLLFMACAAVDVEPELDFEREEETIFKVTEKLAIDMDVEDSGSLEGLRQKLETERYDIVHLSGHADIDKHGTPFFIMEDESGCHRHVTPKELRHEALVENPPLLLFLSGCRTGQTPEARAAVSFAQNLVEKQQVPAVLGWGRPVGDEQAAIAAEVIYHELSRGRDTLSAVQRARQELLEHFPVSQHPAWPMLRLFCSGMPHTPIVKTGQKPRPKARTLVHTYLQNSQVKVLREGFVGRRRQLQHSLRTLKHDQEKVGLLLHGSGGLGKSCLAGKICERLHEHTLIIVHGRLNTVTLENALKEAFILSQDHNAKQILSLEKEMPEKLADLCATSFKAANYLLLFDDFEQNIEGATEGKPGRLLPETIPLMLALLHYLPHSGKMSQLIVTSRYPFSLTEEGKELAKERLEPVMVTSFGKVEQRKKALELVNILNYPNLIVAGHLIAAGHGNPRLMEWLNTLVGEMSNAQVAQLLQAVQDKQEEFIKEHLIRELLVIAGEKAAHFLRRFSVFRLPVREQGARLIAEKAGLNCQKLVERGMGLTLIEHDRARESYQVTPLLRQELWAGLSAEKERHACHQAAFEYYEQECGQGEPLDPILTEEWIYHALGCGHEDVASDKGGDLVNYLREHLAYLESKSVGEWVLSEKKQPLKTGDDAYLLNELASMINALGEHQQAIDYYRQALAIDRAVYGDQHPDVAIDLNNLGEA